MKNIIKNKYIIASCVMLASLLCSCFDREFDAEQYITEYPEITVTDFNPKTARPTAEVTITGTNFLGVRDGVEVSFGGIAVGTDTSIVSYSENEMVVKVPEGAMSGDLTVTVYTNSATATGEFTYLEGAVIDSIFPSTAGAGESVTVYGDKFGTDMSAAFFYFYDSVPATVTSVSENEIVVTVPEGVRSGNPTLIIDGQTLEVPKFTIPVIGAYFEFLGGKQGWITSGDATSEVSDGKFNVTYGATKGADFILDGKITVLTSEFPIIAIAIEDVPFGDDAVFTLKVDGMKFNNSSKNYDGVLNDKYYYYDLRKSLEYGITIPEGEETEIDIEWTISGADASQTGYSVDWIQSFPTVDELRELVNAETPAGFYAFSFDDDAQQEWSVQTANSVYSYSVVKDGFLDVPYFNSGTYFTAYFQYSPLSGEKWNYSSNYPIFAFKLTFYDAEGNDQGAQPLTEGGAIKKNNVKFRNKANRGADATYASDYHVLYWDFPNANLGTSAPTEGENDSWFIKIPSNYGYSDATETDPHAKIKVDWVRTFKTVEDLEAFLLTQDKYTE